MDSGSRAATGPGLDPSGRIRVQVGDLARLQVDGVVVPVDPSLEGGGAVAAALHLAAGPKLAEECHTIGACPVGEARLTGGYALPARWVIHTAAPPYGPGSGALLGSCYTESLRLAARNEQRSLAFPAIGAGAAGFPLELAASVAVRSVAAWLVANPLPREVVFCCTTEAAAGIYRRTLASFSLGSA